MTDDLSGLPAFVAAAEAGGFAAAADRLNVSRSAVGKTVAKLEQRLGVRLFNRTTRSQSLTESGQIFYEHCFRGLAEVRAGAAMLESGRHEVAGRLRVAMPVIFGRRCVAPILIAFAAKHPKLELELSLSDAYVELAEERFDLGVRNGLLGDWTGLKTRRVTHQQMTLCAAPSYLSARGMPQSIDELQSHDAVIYSRGGHLHTWNMRDAAGKNTIVTPTPRVRLDDLDAISDAAVVGLGIAWLPTWLIRDRIETGHLVCVLEHLPAVQIDSHLAWPQTSHLPLRVRRAIDILAERLPLIAER